MHTHTHVLLDFLRMCDGRKLHKRRRWCDVQNVVIGFMGLGQELGNNVAKGVKSHGANIVKMRFKNVLYLLYWWTAIKSCCRRSVVQFAKHMSPLEYHVQT